RVLCRELWKIEPEFIAGEPGFESKVSATTAGVIIGDRTFNFEKNYAYQFDLAEEWQTLTGLPFVFAAWVSNKKLSDEFITQFNQVMQEGLSQLDQCIKTSTQRIISEASLKEYLTTYINFDFDNKKKQAMQLFLSKLG
ncbi:MAG: hypothetical protein QMC40_06450, partial [Vicingaceae bacterium]